MKIELGTRGDGSAGALSAGDGREGIIMSHPPPFSLCQRSRVVTLTNQAFNTTDFHRSDYLENAVLLKMLVPDLMVTIKLTNLPVFSFCLLFLLNSIVLIPQPPIRLDGWAPTECWIVEFSIWL